MFLGVGSGRVRGRHLPPGDARLLQGAALPRRRQRDPRACTTRYHATHSHDDAQDMRNMGGLRQLHAGTFGADVDRDARDRRHPAVLRLLLEGRDPGVGVRAAGAGQAGVTTCSAALGVAGRAAHGVLHDPADGDDLPRARTGPARRSRRHLHEAPWIMTGPLVVLGVLSVVGGLLNLPHFAGGARVAGALARAGDSAPSHALAQLAHAARDRTELALIGVAVLIGVVGPGARRARGHAAAPIATAGRRGAGDRLRARAERQVLRRRDLRPRSSCGRCVWFVAHGALEARRPGLVDGVAVNGQRPPAQRLRLARQPRSRPGSSVSIVLAVRRRRRAGVLGVVLH